jgi:hypothetical protein
MARWLTTRGWAGLHKHLWKGAAMKTPPDPESLWPNSLPRKFLEEVTSDIMSKAPVKTEEEKLIERANIVTTTVREDFLARFALRVTPMKFKDAADEIRKMYREHYRSWSHDELIEFCALKDGILAAQSLRSDLI